MKFRGSFRGNYYTSLTLNTSKKVLDLFLFNITKAVSEDDYQITLPGFGTFEKIIRNPRTCRNPQTGETMKIEARSGVRFKAGAKFKQAVMESK